MFHLTVNSVAVLWDIVSRYDMICEYCAFIHWIEPQCAHHNNSPTHLSKFLIPVTVSQRFLFLSKARYYRFVLCARSDHDFSRSLTSSSICLGDFLICYSFFVKACQRIWLCCQRSWSRVWCMSNLSLESPFDVISVRIMLFGFCVVMSRVCCRGYIQIMDTPAYFVNEQRDSCFFSETRPVQ